MKRNVRPAAGGGSPQQLKEEVQQIATDSETKADGITRVPDTRSQKSQVRTRGGDFRPAALVQLGNGTMARDEEEAELALPVAATVERGHESAQEMGRTSVDQSNAKHADIHNGTRHGALARLPNTRHMWEDTER